MPVGATHGYDLFSNFRDRKAERAGVGAKGLVVAFAFCVFRFSCFVIHYFFMVRHVVMWRLKEFALGNSRAVNAALLRDRLVGLRGLVTGMVALEAGVDYSGTASSFDVVLYSEFTDRVALESYQVHPEHEAVKAFVVEVSAERAVVDYEE